MLKTNTNTIIYDINKAKYLVYVEEKLNKHFQVSMVVFPVLKPIWGRHCLGYPLSRNENRQ